jgi:predicted secreted protein
MIDKKKPCVLIIALILSLFCLWGGDNASFVDLGFSPDGKTYMFGQYGVQSQTLKPWADLFVVDVSQNDFVPNGRISYIHDRAVIAGQDGSGALYRLISRNTSLADRYDINFLHQGQALYITPDNGGNLPSPGETIEFRDFEAGVSYKAALVSLIEGSGADLKSSFYINLERNAQGGAKKYIVGSPRIKRSLIVSYRIKKVMVAPRDGSIVFVVEMRKQGADGTDIRYMVEALRL